MKRSWTALTGVVFFVVLLVAVLIDTNLDATSSGEKVLSSYTAHRDRLMVSGWLTVIAVFVGVFFYGFLRDYLRENEKVRGLAATAFGGVLLFAASGCIGAGANFALTDSPHKLTPGTAQTLYLISTDVDSGFSEAGIAILLVAFGMAIVLSRLLPTWLGWVAFPFAIVALIPPVAWLAFPATGIWTLVVSIALWRRLTTAESSGVAPSPALG